MMNIETLNLKWSEGTLIDTRRGPRMLRVASPTANFWGAWKRDKQAIQDLGISVSKHRGEWEICLWVDPAAEVTETILTAASSTPHIAGDKTETDAAVNWSAEQQAIFEYFRTGSGNAVVQARAGTGKTTTIKHAFSVAPEAAMLYAVFNKKNQREAEAKITDPRVEVRTLHSLGFLYIQSVWRGVKPDDNVERERIEFVHAGLTDDAAGAIERLVGFAKNTFACMPTVEQLIDLAADRGIFASDESEYPVAKLASIALEALRITLVKSDRISFNDMVWLPVVNNWVSPRFDLVCIDEAQDMNMPQLEMAIRACKTPGRICVVGDDRQAIYGFRGAASDGMGLMKTRLAAITLGLTTTYRCPKSVVALAAELVNDYRAAETAPEGIVDSIALSALVEHAKVGDAILSRLNAPLMSTCLQLLRRGVSARIEGRDIGRQLVGMVRKLKAKSVPDFLRKLNAWGEKQTARLNCGSRNAEAKVALVADQVATLTAVAEDAKSISDIENRINSLFEDSDSKTAKPAVVLSSVHKAKGLEWNRVFVLRDTFKPSRGLEEANIYYVAITRTKAHLTFVE
jgi:DNA helicase-2/ATP-dependent DNA helicase PcrA